ncbi:DUF1634 domain-containing protein [Chlorogloeopsis fritschii PCC 9212]|jgi:uncharacterized membrane protein|uniref:DUF1634 domain-containing protein n=1 Tax=Chlorogloeopsis fritschii PCC 6912 TaxID=211165 RepID=A0A433MY24_CHLFR|nr:DUF1634 domain-containing protein [Chlorogloeopsis fritschii]MBF2008722.1 DUF1634 domain-containing protein [Chlorogloeopsis fritschii C42_A2020_084]RUR73180.1 hypothetical protein PCC6912_58590 [Chlorogloeopsis fritschii PCC 6912]
MFKLNSNLLSTSIQPDSQVISLPLQLQNTNSDINTLAKPSLESTDTKFDAESQQSRIIQNSQPLSILLSYLLKYGVLLASSVVLFGGILYLLQHGAEPVHYQFFYGEPSEFCSPTGVVTAVLSGSRRGIIQLGLLLLVATPILRVVVSLLFFVKQRNWIYVTITTLVLTALIYSLVGAY